MVIGKVEGVGEKKEGRKVRNAPALPALESDLSF
jgi:hypothetical protein